MPPRISRSSVKNQRPPKAQSNAPRKPKKAAKRALDAFAIASREFPDRIKLSRTRAGELEGPSHRKRARHDDDEEDDEEDEDEPRRQRQKRDANGDTSYDEGSDSEGNNWTMGHVDDDEDSDIDSDEAFGESDEEKFEGWTFRGSSTTKKGAQKKTKRSYRDDDDDMGRDINLDEDDIMDDEDDDEDDLGEDAIDLATALDQYESSEDEQEKPKKSKKKIKSRHEFDSSDESDNSADDFTGFSSEEDESGADSEKLEQLHSLISTLPDDDQDKEKTKRKADVHEFGAPSEFGVMRKVDLMNFKPKTSDPERKKALKMLQDDAKQSKRNDIARKLDAPLPKRQQDKLDRAAANEKANETLGRWVDTVKQNRQAEHLIFPLQHPSGGVLEGETRLMPTTTTAPANDLEAAIQSILQESGLSNGKEDEEKLQKWEELQTNKLPLEEVARRRAELRMQRDLLFREEVRAKRVKKIKSKAYRRVHRKERERLLQRERDALKAEGIDVSEDEKEYNDRRRAEERMGSKHRESKWAKGIKASGRAAWDEDARDGVNDMARRNEELRRRMEGKEIYDEDEDRSDLSSDEDDDEDDDDTKPRVLEKQLSRLSENPFSTKETKLGSMAFMKKAEAAQKAQNDEDIERMRRELAGEETPSEEEGENFARVGRKKFGPGTASMPKVSTIPKSQSEFEERLDSDAEERKADSGNVVPDSPNHIQSNTVKKQVKPKPPKGQSKNSKHTAAPQDEAPNPFLGKLPSSSKKVSNDSAITWDVPELATNVSISKATAKSKKSTNKSSEPILSAPDEDGFQTVSYANGDDSDEESDGVEDEDLVLRGFAGDQDTLEEFAKEKQALADEEAPEDKVNVLPGWGSWAGEGLTRKQQRRNQGLKTVTHKAGTDHAKRKDAKLDRVILSQKTLKGNKKYMADILPFPFETKEQYERSLRLPKGREWQTKASFQDGTKPRVIVKQGIIRPLHKPLV